MTGLCFILLLDRARVGTRVVYSNFGTDVNTDIMVTKRYPIMGASDAFQVTFTFSPATFACLFSFFPFLILRPHRL